MIDAEDWIASAQAHGFDFYAGVPCSLMGSVIDAAIESAAARYIGAASEGEAVALACGAWLGGRRPVVIGQNSGFGNMVNPLTSLSWTFQIPHLLAITWRGQPGLGDEPQHELMGRTLESLLDTLELPHALLPSAPEDLGAAFDRADATLRATQRPYAFVVRKGSLAPSRGVARRSGAPSRVPETAWLFASRLRGRVPELARADALAAVVDSLGTECAYLATTGKLGRELYTHGDGFRNFYNVGAMGCVSAIGLGVALARPERRVVVLDGDGSLLMKLGNLATIGHWRPENLVHVVFDNERHESTGGQWTSSSSVRFAELAAGVGYRYVAAGESAEDLKEALERAHALPGPILIHQKVAVSTDASLGRPEIAPAQVARRFRNWLAGDETADSEVVQERTS